MNFLILAILILSVCLWILYRYRRRFRGLNNPLPPRTNDLELASNQTTDPATLAGLASSSHRSIRQLVVSNSNTPIDILIRLAVEFPYEVAANPSFGLLLLENPAFVSELGFDRLRPILEQNSELPDVFIDGAVRHQSSNIPVFALYKFQLSEQNLELMLGNVYASTMADRIIFEQPNSTDRLKLIAARSGNKYLQAALLKFCFSRKPVPSIELLETLIDHAHIDIQLQMVNHPQMTEELLERLFSPDRADLLRRIQWRHYGYPNALSSSMQWQMAQNQLADITSRIEVRQTLARIPPIDRAIVELLSRDPYGRVRGEVAKRGDLTREIIWQLAEDKSDVVQNGLVKNYALDGAMLAEMSAHPSIRVRQLAARHPKTPAHILAELAREPALQTLIIRNPYTSIDLLRQLACNGQHDIALTQNPHTPYDILQPILAKLALDPSYSIRKLVARHPHTSRALLSELANDAEIKVSRIARSRLA